jgi:uncharacterized integral membrane protein (TIGR00698 family)
MKNRFSNFSIGILISLIIALSSQSLSKLLGTQVLQLEKSPISPIFLALIIGVLIANTTSLADLCDLGITFCIKYILKIGIILMGIRLGLNEMISFGIKGFLVVTPCIILTLLLVEKSRAYFKLSSNLATLIAVGTSICGATAIVATAPAINAKKEEIAYAIANISIFGIFAMVVYPFVAHYFFPGNPLSAGLFLGSSIHETGQVAGAGMIYADQYLSPKVFDVSTVTKLVRNTAMLVVIPYLSFKHTNYKETDISLGKKLYQIFPFFILGFLFLGLVRTFGDYSLEQNSKAFGLFNIELWNGLIFEINFLSKLLLTIAMAAIGISTDLKKLKLIGLKVFYYGFAIALFVGVISLLTTLLFFGL